MEVTVEQASMLRDRELVFACRNPYCGDLHTIYPVTKAEIERHIQGKLN